mmetsp:Transcript_53875/g.109607  ORF Transcript_53875/g.109607 Transcript_53875/m.109607 type:complete len:354 (+) Transcript_53875:942-2003(+)
MAVQDVGHTTQDPQGHLVARTHAVQTRKALQQSFHRPPGPGAFNADVWHVQGEAILALQGCQHRLGHVFGAQVVLAPILEVAPCSLQEPQARLQQVHSHCKELRIRVALRRPYEESKNHLQGSLGMCRSQGQSTIATLSCQHLVELAHDPFQVCEGGLQLLTLHIQQADQGFHLAGGGICNTGRAQALQGRILQLGVGHSDQLEHQFLSVAANHSSRLRVQGSLLLTEEADQLHNGLEVLQHYRMSEFPWSRWYLVPTANLPQVVEGWPFHGEAINQGTHLVQRSNHLTGNRLSWGILSMLVAFEDHQGQSQRPSHGDWPMVIVLQDAVHVLHQLSPEVMALNNFLHQTARIR